jgi:hypothetical protein
MECGAQTLQPLEEILLQICCRCSNEKNQMHFQIASGRCQPGGGG